MIDPNDLQPGDIVIWGIHRFEFVRAGCGGDPRLEKCPTNRPFAAYMVDNRGNRIAPGAGTHCISGDEVTRGCITCGKPLTDEDPAVTTLGPRCKEHF